MPEAGTVTTPTEPTPPVTPPEAASPPAVPSTPPAEPAAGDTTLLGKPAEGDPKPPEPAKPAEPAKPEGAPEKYEFKDADKFDATVLGSFSEAAKAANLPQDAAQKFLDTVAPKLAERAQSQVEAAHKQWIADSQSDKEFGGDKIKENLGVAKLGLNTLDPIPADSKLVDEKGKPTTALRTFLEASGLGNHPEMIRLLYRAGKAISEDKFVTGGPGGKTQVDVGAVLYDKTAGKE